MSKSSARWSEATIDVEGDVALPPLFVVGVPKGVAKVVLTPDNETAPPTAPSAPVTPLRVTVTKCGPGGGFVTYQSSTRIAPDPPNWTSGTRDLVSYMIVLTGEGASLFPVLTPTR